MHFVLRFCLLASLIALCVAKDIDYSATLKKVLVHYSQTFEISKDSCPQFIVTGDSLTLLQKNVHIIIQALLKSKEEVDLTSHLFDSLAAAQSFIYRAMKEYISKCGRDTITKTEIEKMVSKEIYYPIQEIITAASLNKNIKIDFNKKKNNRSFLMLATLYRLYRVFPVFAQLSDTSGSLHAAILNGDDLALAILLQNGVSPTKSFQMSFPSVHCEDFEDCSKPITPLELSEKLKFSSLTRRLKLVIEDSSNNAKLRPENVFAPISSSQTLCGHYLFDRKEGKQNHYTKHSTEKSSSFFSEFDVCDIIVGLNRSSSTTSSSLELSLSETLVSLTKYPFCEVDTVLASEITSERFAKEYLMLNKPVIIQFNSLENPELHFGVNPNDWEFLKFIKLHGSKNVDVSEIPYGDIFGHNLKAQKVKDYIKKDMKEFTNKLNEWLVDIDSSKFSCQQNESGESICENKETNNKVDEKRNQEEMKWYDNFDPYDDIPSYAFKSMGTSIPLDFSPSRNALLPLLLVTTDSELTNLTSHKDKEAFPQSALASGVWKLQLFLGPALSGAPLHSHGPAFNGIVKGHKLWTLSPPGNDVYSSVHPVSWLMRGGAYPSQPARAGESAELARVGPCLMHQREGEVAFVPRHWTHQVLNLRETLGFAIEVNRYNF